VGSMAIHNHASGDIIENTKSIKMIRLEDQLYRVENHMDPLLIKQKYTKLELWELERLQYYERKREKVIRNIEREEKDD